MDAGAALGIGLSAEAFGGRGHVTRLRGALAKPETWSYIYFVGSIAILAGLYFGFGGFKGDVAS